jgi:hypothetical protein
MQAIVTRANQAKARWHRLWASCKPHCTLANQIVTTFVTTLKDEASQTADASFKDGLWHAFLTCVVLAPPPLMYVLYMANVPASWYREVPLWYGLVIFMNVPEKMMSKTVAYTAECVFATVACVLCFFGIWHWTWVLLMCFLSVQTMKGKGLVWILWQLRREVIMYFGLRECVGRIGVMKPSDKEAVVEADNMIWYPDTFLLCCMAAFTWKTWAKAGWNFDLRSWTRILSCKRAFVALMFWRILFFGLMTYCVYLFVMCVYGIAMYLCSAGEPAKPEFRQSTPEPEPNGTSNLTQAEREAKFAKLREYAKERAKK